MTTLLTVSLTLTHKATKYYNVTKPPCNGPWDKKTDIDRVIKPCTIRTANTPTSFFLNIWVFVAFSGATTTFPVFGPNKRTLRQSIEDRHNLLEFSSRIRWV